jgi:hypothetical protein
MILGGVHDGVRCLGSGLLDLDNDGVHSLECLLLHSFVRFGVGDLDRCLLRLLSFLDLPFDLSRDFLLLSLLGDRLRFFVFDRERLRSTDLDLDRDNDLRFLERRLFFLFLSLETVLRFEGERRVFDAERRVLDADLLLLDADLLGGLGVRVFDRDALRLISLPNLSFNRLGFSAIKALTS